MKKQYTDPTVEIEKFTMNPVFTGSTNYDDLGNGDDYEFPGEF